MQKHFIPLTVVFTLMLLAVFSGYNSFQQTREEIAEQLNSAMKVAMSRNLSDVVNADTIRVYKKLRSISNGRVVMAFADPRFVNALSEERLRRTAFVSFDLANHNYESDASEKGYICSDTLFINDLIEGENVAFRGYVRLSGLEILRLSNQCTSLLLLAFALFWMLGSYLLTLRQRTRETLQQAFGGLVYVPDERRFYDTRHQEVRFTPMQVRLMQMFWEAPHHELGKEEICQALWPKKDAPEETLYTLMKRIKPTLEANSRLEITCRRGEGYLLRTKRIGF